MKRKFFLWAISSIALFTSMSAYGLKKPEVPEKPTTAGEFVSGHSYFVRNVDTYQYLTGGNSWSTQISLTCDGIDDEKNPAMMLYIADSTATMYGVSVSGYSMRINGSYKVYGDYGIRNVGETYLFRDSEEHGFIDHAGQPRGYIWRITKVGEYYRIQSAENDPNYPNAAEQYAGSDGEIGYDMYGTTAVVTFNLAEGQDINWEFIPADDYLNQLEVYATRMRLYDALNYLGNGGWTYPEAEEVYNNKDATKAELEETITKVRVAIAKALHKFKGASEDSPLDVTDQVIVNPSFDFDISDWDITMRADNKQWQNRADGQVNTSNNWVQISRFIEAWAPNALGDGAISQTVYSLPAGKYVLECDAMATLQGGTPNSEDAVEGVYLFIKGNDQLVRIPVKSPDYQPKHWQLTFGTEDCDVMTLGLMTENTTANWISADNFRLLYYGEVKHKLTYVLDGQVYNSMDILFGSQLTLEEAPTKEGHTFSGWSEIPATMPDEDVTVTGSFIVNKYKLTYMVDGETYKTTEVEYGSTITPEEAPKKTGYSFSGWNDIPTTMPAQDVTVTGKFTANKYTLTYKVDGETYKSTKVTYGNKITAEAEPAKEGYTFSGWSEIPETMPAKNVTVTGTFTVNSYTLTYVVDGETYKTATMEYGSAITAEAAPTKTGHTFSGWSEIPETMPASDVTVTGTFTVNKYKLIYKVDGQTYKTYTIAYGSTITPEAAPTKEYYTFSGWSTIPTTMPAKNVTVTGSFTPLRYCAAPTITYEEGKLTFDCETEGAICHGNIADADVKEFEGNELDLTVTYAITVYATCEGYGVSPTVTATLCWLGSTPTADDGGNITVDMADVKARPVMIQNEGSTLVVSGVEAETHISVYDLGGRLMGSGTATEGTTRIPTNLKSGQVAIVRMGAKSVKVRF